MELILTDSLAYLSDSTAALLALAADRADHSMSSSFHLSDIGVEEPAPPITMPNRQTQHTTDRVEARLWIDRYRAIRTHVDCFLSAGVPRSVDARELEKAQFVLEHCTPEEVAFNRSVQTGGSHRFFHDPALFLRSHPLCSALSQCDSLSLVQNPSFPLHRLVHCEHLLRSRLEILEQLGLLLHSGTAI